MVKPEMPNMAGMASMQDAFDFMKKMWGGMNVTNVGMPGMVMPTFSVEEINKQIADLKAVEAWLGVNMNMLRSTIQALEVQSATLSALQSMGQNFDAAMKAASTRPQTERKAEPAEEKPAARKQARPRASEEHGRASEPKNGKTGKPAADKPVPEFAQAMANPAAWWSLLQNQFKQAVDGVAPAKPPAASGAKSKTAAPRKRKAPPPVA